MINREVVIDLTGQRGALRCPMGWTMSLLERAKRAPGRTRFLDHVLWFEKTPGNIAYMKEQFGGNVRGETAPDPAALSATRPPFQSATEPDWQQAEALYHWAGKRLFAFYEKPGVGKSKIIADALVQLWCDGKIDGAIIASFNVVHEQWALDELPKHMHESIPRQIAIYRSGRKWDQSIIEPSPDRLRILCINHEAVLAKKAQPLVEGFTASGRIAFVLDESQVIKNPAGALSFGLSERKRYYPVRWIASGEPTPQGLHDYYAQFRFLDQSLLGVQTYAGFKLQYCVMGGWDGSQVVDYHNTGILHERMAPYVHTAELELEAKQYWFESKYALHGLAARYYEEMRRDLMVELDNGGLATAASQLVALMRLQQIACGRLVLEDRTVETFPTDRPDLLRSLLKQNEGKQIIIWNRYLDDMAWQKDMLGDRAAVINGSVPKKHRLAIRDSFLRGDVEYLIGSPGAMGTGFNLQGKCWTNIYYANSDNAGHRWQSERRTYRRGTEHDVYYWDILARSTVEIGILARYRRKRTLSDMSRAEFRAILEGN